MSLTSAFEAYLKTVEGVTTGTLDSYRRLANRSWLPLLGPLPVSAITDDDVKRWIKTELAKVIEKGPHAGVKLPRSRSKTFRWTVALALTL